MSDSHNPLSRPLTHGEVRWILLAMGFGGQDRETAFDGGLKDLRRAGVPFGDAAPGEGHGVNLLYGFPRLAELILAHALFERGLRLRHVAALLAGHRVELDPLYATALAQAAQGLGRPREIRCPGRDPVTVAGVWLRWPIHVQRECVIAFHPPRLIDAWEAIVDLTAQATTLRVTPPLPLSDLLGTAVSLSAQVPVIRRGRPPGGRRTRAGEPSGHP